MCPIKRPHESRELARNRKQSPASRPVWRERPKTRAAGPAEQDLGGQGHHGAQRRRKISGRQARRLFRRHGREARVCGAPASAGRASGRDGHFILRILLREQLADRRSIEIGWIDRQRAASAAGAFLQETGSPLREREVEPRVPVPGMDLGAQFARLEAIGRSLLLEGFDTANSLYTYLGTAVNFKLAGAIYREMPVASGILLSSLGRSWLPIALGGTTEARLSTLPFTLFIFGSEAHSDNAKIFGADVGGNHTLYQLTKVRIGKPGQHVVCSIETGMPAPTCINDSYVPFVWLKLINTPDTPITRRDLQRTNAQFPTYRFYAPSGRASGNRRFPLVQDPPLMEQIHDPVQFIRNPDDSNQN